MPSVNGAKTKYERNTTREAYDEGVAEFGGQEEWENEVRGSDYTGGVEAFLESEGGVDDAEVTEDYDWESQTLSATWTTDGNAYEEATGEGSGDTWFERYANAFGDNA